MVNSTNTPTPQDPISNPSITPSTQVLQSSVPDPSLEPIKNIIIDPQTIRSYDVIFEVVKRRMEEQRNQLLQLDTKAGFVLGSASLLIAGVAAFQKTVYDFALVLAQAKLHIDNNAQLLIQILVGIVILFYLFIVGAGFAAYRARVLATVGNVNDLRRIYLDKDETLTKVVLLDTYIETIEKFNDPVIQRKLIWTQRALVAFLIETFLIAFMILGQVLLLNGMATTN